MADELFDKLTAETSLKPNFNGLEVKEIKKKVENPVVEASSRRIVVPPSPPHKGGTTPDWCANAPANADVTPTNPAGGPVVYLSLKTSPTNPKGSQPLLIKDAPFVPQHDDSIKLEAEALVFYTTGNTAFDAAFELKVPTKLWVFNPNEKPVAVDVKFGFGPKPAAAALAPAPKPVVGAPAPAPAPAPAAKPVKPPAAGPAPRPDDGDTLNAKRPYVDGPDDLTFGDLGPDAGESN